MTVSERSPSVLDLYSRRISCVAELPASTPCSSLRRSTTPTFKQRTPDLPPKLTSVTKRTPGDLQHRGPSTRAPYDPSHRHPVLGGRRHRRCSCAGPGRGSANRNDSIGSGRSDRSRRSCCTVRTSRDAALHDRQLVLSRARTAQPTSDLTGRTCSASCPPASLWSRSREKSLMMWPRSKPSPLAWPRQIPIDDPGLSDPSTHSPDREPRASGSLGRRRFGKSPV